METQVILWLLGLVGMALGVAITYILNDIRQSIRDVNQCMRGLRKDIVQIDNRVTRLEVRQPVDYPRL